MSRWWRRRNKAHSTAEGESRSTEMTTVDEHNFVEATSGRLTAVDFWAPWCAPCRAFTPVFEEVARRNADQVAFGKCNVDDNGALAALLQIRSIPTVVLFGPDGNEVDRISGFLTRRQLERMVLGALERAEA